MSITKTAVVGATTLASTALLAASVGTANAASAQSAHSTQVKTAMGAAAPVSKALKLSPHGYGRLKIGMSEQRARKTGMIVLKTHGPACDGYDLKGHPTGRDTVGVYVSHKYGVALIQPPKNTRTTRGIHIGSTLAQAKHAYPGLKRNSQGYYGVAAPGNPQALYEFDISRGKVNSMTLILKVQDCFG
ncbi:hypothetical protein [Actinomadura mexicana]|uniref:Uncharacterized protein n=1 Tax=Actinomadura mexicana TaxID=134959 RepID=A0A239GXK6_9ACTN|nr:hypothetical protein [Actinomadura mexicana]SNS73890.1 hypothetical protein SAMN06265355_12710 [Actinomadura mexicana]